MFKRKACSLLEHETKRFLLAARSDAQKREHDEWQHHEHDNDRERPSDQKSFPMMPIHDHEDDPDEHNLIEAGLLREAQQDADCYEAHEQTLVREALTFRSRQLYEHDEIRNIEQCE